jgi:hypothetical protein
LHLPKNNSKNFWNHKQKHTFEPNFDNSSK